MKANENWTHFETNTERAGLSIGGGWCAKVFFSRASPPSRGISRSSECAEKAAQCTELKTGGSVMFCGVFGGVLVEEGSLQNESSLGFERQWWRSDVSDI